MNLGRKGKRILLIFGVVLMIGTITGCSSKIDLGDYVDIDYSGLDGTGEASARVDESRLVSDTFDINDIEQDRKTYDEKQDMLESYEVEVKPNQNLKNGDEIEVVFTVDSKKSKRLSDKSKKVIVKGLEEGKPITDKELKENVLITFTGADGKGEISIDNNFMNPDLKNINFIAEENGNLKNGDDVVVEVDPENIDYLTQNKYQLSDSGSFKVKVEGLKGIAKNIDDIANLDDVTRLLSEEAISKYKTNSYSDIDYENVGTYYRELYSEGNEIFPPENSSGSEKGADTFGNGSVGYLLKITNDKGGDYEKQHYTLFAFPSVVIDEDKKASIGDLGDPMEYEFKEEYSLETIKLKLESEGFKIK